MLSGPGSYRASPGGDRPNLPVPKYRLTHNNSGGKANGRQEPGKAGAVSHMICGLGSRLCGWRRPIEQDACAAAVSGTEHVDVGVANEPNFGAGGDAAEVERQVDRVGRGLVFRGIGGSGDPSEA